MLSMKYVYKSYIYLIYMYKEDPALNNQQWLICYKTKPKKVGAVHSRKEKIRHITKKFPLTLLLMLLLPSELISKQDVELPYV